MVLTTEVHKQFIKTMVDATKGHTAIISSVSSPNVKDVVAYTEFSQKCGVEAVIAMPPYVGDLNFDGVKSYFKSIANATELLGASLLTAKATNYIKRSGIKDIFLVCIGYAGKYPSDEYTLCANYIKSLLLKEEHRFKYTN